MVHSLQKTQQPLHQIHWGNKTTEATRRTKLVISEPLRHYLVNIQPHHLKDVVLHLSIPATEKKQDMQWSVTVAEKVQEAERLK